jgi:trehalose 6-phosphate synthase
VADAIRIALKMPLKERIARWERMNAVVQEQDVLWWRQRFTQAMIAEKPTVSAE